MPKKPKQEPAPSNHSREKQLMKQVALLAAAYGAKKLYDAVKKKIENNEKSE